MVTKNYKTIKQIGSGSRTDKTRSKRILSARIKHRKNRKSVNTDVSRCKGKRKTKRNMKGKKNKTWKNKNGGGEHLGKSGLPDVTHDSKKSGILERKATFELRDKFAAGNIQFHKGKIGIPANTTHGDVIKTIHNNWDRLESEFKAGKILPHKTEDGKIHFIEKNDKGNYTLLTPEKLGEILGIDKKQNQEPAKANNGTYSRLRTQLKIPEKESIYSVLHDVSIRNKNNTTYAHLQDVKGEPINTTYATLALPQEKAPRRSSMSSAVTATAAAVVATAPKGYEIIRPLPINPNNIPTSKNPNMSFSNPGYALQIPNAISRSVYEEATRYSPNEKIYAIANPNINKSAAQLTNMSFSNPLYGSANTYGEKYGEYITVVPPSQKYNTVAAAQPIENSQGYMVPVQAKGNGPEYMEMRLQSNPTNLGTKKLSRINAIKTPSEEVQKKIGEYQQQIGTIKSMEDKYKYIKGQIGAINTISRTPSQKLSDLEALYKVYNDIISADENIGSIKENKELYTEFDRIKKQLTKQLKQSLNTTITTTHNSSPRT